MSRLIGITGRANAGKDTLALMLVESHGFRRAAFAEPVKKICALLSAERVENFHCRTLKEKYSPALRMTRRKAMQLVGTEVGREMFHEDIWVDALITRWLSNGKPDTVVSDVRMDNEAIAIRAEGGIIINLTRGEPSLVGEEAMHSSEDGIHPSLVDFHVANDGDLAFLAEHAARIAAIAKEHTGACR